MNKKLAIIAIGIAISIILGGFNSSVLFGTDYLTSKIGYTYSVAEALDWWDCNWSYSKKIIIHHEYVEADQTDFPVLIYNSSDDDLIAHAQPDGGDIVFVDRHNLTQYDHEIERFDPDAEGVPFVAWVEISSLSSTEDTILYMYYGNPDCENQWNIAGTWNSGYKLVQHLNETSGTHYDSTSNYNNGTVSGTVTQGTTQNGLLQMDGLDYFSDGSGYINFGNDSSLSPTSLTLEAWVKDPPLGMLWSEKSKSNVKIVDKRQEQVSLVPNKAFTVERTITSDVPTDVVFVALFSPGVFIQNMMVDNDSVFSGAYHASMPESDEEYDIEQIRKKLPDKVKGLETVAYSKPFRIDNKTSVEMQFKTVKLNNVFSDGKISYLVIASDDSYDAECTTHWNSFLSIWKPPSFFYEFIKSLFGEDEEASLEVDTGPSDIYISSLVETYIEEWGNARVIIRFKDGQGSFFEKTDYMESLGFVKTAEVDSEGVVAGFINSAVFEDIKKSQDITGIYLDKSFDILLNESLPLIHFNQTVQEFGLTGSGTRICILDTGVDSSVVGYSYGYDFVNGDDDPHDDNGHGTRVVAVLKSIAPEAELIVAKVIGSEGVGYESDVLEGLQYCIDQEPDIICFSIGSSGSCSGFCDVDFVASMCNDAVDNGIFVVAASGNDGSQNLTSPACGSKVFSVGATDDYDVIASFSNVNPTLDLFAPGVDITTIAGTSSGTSMSVPHVAAAVALVLENEDLDPTELKYRLRSTGKPISYVYNDSLKVDICRLDIYNAVVNNKTCEPYNYSWWWQCYIEESDQGYIPLDVAPQEYYFNARSNTDYWETNPDQMVDGITTNYASTTSHKDVELCISNTCDGTDLGTIAKVEIRAYGYKSVGGKSDYITLRPVFDDGDGDNHDFTNPIGSGSADWSSYYDITSDNNAPSPWTWSNVSSLDCDVEANIDTEGITHYCSKVEIQVTINNTPDFSGETPSNRTTNVNWDTTSINVTIEDAEGDKFNWTIETSPNVGSSANTSADASRSNGSKTCSVSGLKPGTTYTWYVNATDEGSSRWRNETYTFTTEQIELINCTTNKSVYTSGDTAKFTAWVDAFNGTKVTLLIANSTANLESCNYTNRDSCIANSSNITIAARSQQINATMTASSSTTWYAKICDNESRFSYMYENKTAWNKTYNSGGSGGDTAYSVAVDSNDNVYVVGYGYQLNGSTGSDWWIMKFNSTGDRKWNKTYNSGGSGIDYAYSVAVDSNDNVYVVGSGEDLNGSTSNDWWIMKFNSTGDRDWNKTYNSGGSGSDAAYSVAVDSNDNVYVVGYGEDLNGSTNPDWWIMKFNSTGARKWNKTYDGKGSNDIAYSVAVDSNDNVYVVGSGTNLNGSTSNDWWIMKFNTTGDRKWNKTYHGGSGSDIARSVATDSNDNVYVVGSGTNLNGSTSYDWWIMKFNSTGDRKWNKTYHGGSGSDIARSVAVDSNDNVYVVGDGADLNGSTSNDWWIKKFNSTTGAQDTSEWNKAFDGNGSSDMPRSVANDSNDNIYVVGYGYNLNGSTNNDWWIKKFEYFTGTFDANTPSIEFIDPTPYNNTHRNDTWINVTLSTSDENQHYAFADFNYDNVLWMRMDDRNGTGDPQDLSSYNNSGVLKGNAVINSSSGYFGDGAHLNTSDTINIPTSDSLNVSSITVSAWINLDVFSLGFNYIVWKRWNFNGYRFAVYNDNHVVTRLYLVLGNGTETTWNNETLSEHFSVGNWYHVSVTYDETSEEVRYYLNGVEDDNYDTISGFGPIAASLSDLLIGYNDVTGMNGSVDEVLVFNRSLNGTEIKALYNASVNQYYHNFSGLSDGAHNFTGYAVDRGGNRNETEERNVTIDTIKPSTQFIDPTPANSTHRNDTWIYVNLSSSDTNQHYAFTDFNKSLVLWMRMDDVNDTGEGATVYDLSSYQNNGTANGNANQTDNGYFGKAFEFDGSGDRIDISNDNSIYFDASEEYTWSAWINPSQLPEDDNWAVLSKGANLQGYAILIDNQGRLGIDAHKSTPPTGDDFSDTIGAIAANVWTHIAITYYQTVPGPTYTFYIDGQSDGTGTMTYFNDDTTNNMKIGAPSAGSHPTINFNGVIDDVMMFTRKLSSAEIQSLYNTSTYQYEHNFTGLSDGYYTFTGYDPDRGGNRNETEERNVTVDTTKPSIEFIDPTPSNGSQAEDYIYVNISSSDTNQHYTFTDFNNDTVLWMRMDDLNGTGDPQDLSSKGNNGLARGNTNQTDNGFYGKAFEFDGSGDYIQIDDDGTSLNFDDQGTYTWSMWVKLEEIGTEQYLLKKESQPAIQTLGYFILVKDDNTVSLAKKNAAGGGLLYQVTTTKTLGADQFYHIAVTFNTESDIKIYIDGVENVSDSGAFDDDTNADMYIGATGSTALNGTLDDVLIFNRNLSAIEIKALYNATDNQYEHNFTGLSLGNYTFTGYDPDRAGNRNQTGPRWRDYSNTPIVITNDTTGMEEGNATLWGYLLFDGGEDCTVRFEYGLTTAYGTNTSNQTKSGGQEFSGIPIAVLNSGTLYYYRAYANNTQGADVGAMDAFLTKPLLPMGLTATTYNQTCINLTWTKGQGANNTYIMRKYGSFPTSQNDGINIYNSTGTSYNDTGLDQKTRYYYRAWAYAEWEWIDESADLHKEVQWSDSYANATAATTTIRLINCSTDKSIYGDGGSVTFTAWVDADVGSSVILLIANSTSNLESCTYTDQDSCVPGLTTSAAVITSQPQAITATMTADSNTTWYAKVCDSEGRCSYMYENKTAWDKTYHMDSDHGESVAVDSNDNVYVVGCGENLNGTSSYDWWIMKFNSTGDREWNKTYDDGGGGSSKESAYSVAVDSNDNVYVVGGGYKLNGTTTDHDWWIMRFNATTGNRDWNKTYDSGGINSNDIAQEVAVDTVDNVYVVGHGTNLNDTTNMDWWIMRFNATTGNRDWNKTYSSGGNNQDVAYSVTTDNNDDVYVVGYGKNLNGSTSNDWWIMKFNSSTSNRDWNKTYDSGSNSVDIAQSVAVDSNDNVYVAGYGTNLNGSTSYDWWIMRFNATTGNRDWNKTYNSGSNDPDAAYSVAVDSNDNVYVAGYGTDLNGSTGYDWWIKRFNSTGSQDVWNWNLTYDGNGGQDYPRSVAVDSNDSVYAVGTGTDLNGSTSYDWWIKKFEYFTGNFTVLHQNKEIIKMSQNTYSLEINSNGTVLYGGIGTTVIDASIDTDWHYVALTYDNSDTNVSLYKDGVLVNSTFVMVAWAYPGTLPNVTSGKYLTGHLDELRISSTARSSPWINTSWQNMNDPTSFATFESPRGVMTTWTYRKKITINGSLVTGAGAGHSNFPVLIYNSSDSNLSNNALSTGNDIIFLNTSADWTTSTWRDKLDHEVEKYDNTTGELVAWVRIPQINVGIDTEIYMYYGNTLCTTNRENVTGVWNSNYVMVHHLNESSGTLYDSTSYDNDGTNVDNNATYNASAKIDGGYAFDGDNDTIDVDDDGTSLDFDDLGTYTWEMWVKLNEVNRDHWLIKKEYHKATNGVYGHGYFILVEDSNNVSIAKPFDGGAQGDLTDNQVWTTQTLNADEFYYIVVTFATEGEITIYINGEVDAGDNGAFNDDTVTNVIMGDNSNDDDGNRSLNGTLDEVRISKTVRTSGWINTTYNNVNDTANFTIFGEQERKNVAPTQSSPSPSDGATDVNLYPTLSITVNDTNADAMNVTFRTNATGSWGDIDTNSSVYNGTYRQTNSSMDSYSTKYWWSVNLTDGSLWNNETYNFTTQAPNYVSFYFNSWDAAEEWTNHPDYMVDGETTKYANTTVEEVELCTDNNYSSESGTITKVEIRAFGYRSGGGISDYINLRPVFGGSKDGDNHTFPPPNGGDWSSWLDITTDTNAPNTWTWTDIQNLDCDVESKLATEQTLYCSKVEVRATYYT